jgi:large subunit ribosomal protein L19
MNLIQSIQTQQLKDQAPAMEPGDTVRVHTRIVEGDRERVQVFQGTVIRIRRGSVNSNFTVRRIASDGIGVERTFLVHSPRVEKVEVMRHGRVRRAQLYYLRGLTGKAARLKGRREEQATAKAIAQE